jgi:hypothetical protein
MSRHTATTVPAARQLDEPHTVHPTTVYTADEVIRIFKLRKSTLRREIREGRLRVARRAGRYYLLGKWLIEWLEGGELTR